MRGMPLKAKRGFVVGQPGVGWRDPATVAGRLSSQQPKTQGCDKNLGQRHYRHVRPISRVGAAPRPRSIT